MKNEELKKGEGLEEAERRCSGEESGQNDNAKVPIGLDIASVETREITEVPFSIATEVGVSLERMADMIMEAVNWASYSYNGNVSIAKDKIQPDGEYMNFTIYIRETEKR